MLSSYVLNGVHCNSLHIFFGIAMSPLLQTTFPPIFASPISLLPNDLAMLRGDMLRFAKLQLRDEPLAEDAVQDALAAALSALDSYTNKAQLKTWVFTILRNKVIDIIRERSRSNGAKIEVDEISDAMFDELFDKNGGWQEDARPADWGNPELSLSNQQFWNIFEICLNRLPESAARIFMMREMLGFETAEICEELGITSSNCWVILHRARMSLRLCLHERWFGAEGRDHEM
jgi:RNA polymerase sigma-70 factor (ECF subfamily)